MTEFVLGGKWKMVREQESSGELQGGEAGAEVAAEDEKKQAAPLMALNHVSRLCKSVAASVEFYTKVLGFVTINRPPALGFDGAWLFNYGVGIHLVQDRYGGARDASDDRLDPMDNHISFQCEDMGAMEERLKEAGIQYLSRTINDEEGAAIDQLFFNDPDGFMIEICNCENLELVPVGTFGLIRLPRGRHSPPLAKFVDIFASPTSSAVR